MAAPGKPGKLHFTLEQTMHRVLETAGQALLLRTHRQKSRAGVEHLATGHGASLIYASDGSLVVPDGSRHHHGMKMVFLRRR